MKLSGAEMALLVASFTILPYWPFAVPGVRAMVTEDVKRSAATLGERLSEAWIGCLSELGLLYDPSGKWTRGLVQKRAGLQVQIGLTVDEVTLVTLAVRAVLREFREKWGEFCGVAPGALDWYPVEPRALERLADRLAEFAHGMDG